MVVTSVWFSGAVTISDVAMEGGSLRLFILMPNDSSAVLPFDSPWIVMVADPFLFSRKSSVKMFPDTDALTMSMLLIDETVFVTLSPSSSVNTPDMSSSLSGASSSTFTSEISLATAGPSSASVTVMVTSFVSSSESSEVFTEISYWLFVS